MLKMQPKQETWHGDKITAKADNAGTHTDCTLAMDGRVVTVLGAVASIDVGGYCLYPVKGDTRIADWEYLSDAMFKKIMVVNGG